jgi:hypothetical protein
MTSIVDTLAEATGNLPQRSTKAAGEAQRNAWLLQLEQAWISNAGTHHSGTDAGESNTDAYRDRMVPSAGQDNSMPCIPSLSDEPSRSVFSAAANSVTGNTAQSEVSADMQSEEAHARDESPRTNSIEKDTRGVTGHAVAQLTTDRFQSADSKAEAVSDISPLFKNSTIVQTGLQGANSLSTNMQVRSEVGGVASTSPILPPQQAKTFSAFGWATAASPTETLLSEKEGKAAQFEDVPRNAFGGSLARNETVVRGDQYAIRNLHLYQNGNTVQAWVRDVELSEIDAYSVAQTLQRELQHSALQLTTLTVNGKQLPISSAHEEEPSDGMDTFVSGNPSRNKPESASKINQTAMNNGGNTHGD